MLRKIAIFLLLSVSAWAARPQQPGPPLTVDQSGAIEAQQLPPIEPQTTITGTSDEREGLIHLDVAARDQDGRSFGNMAATDLTLLQDGTATRILSFHRSNSSDEEERLSEVSLVLDEVDLSPVQFALVKNEAINYLGRNGGVLAQPVSIFWIRTDGVYTSPFPTTDGSMLAGDIASNHAVPTVWKFHPEAQPVVTGQLDVTSRPPEATSQTGVTVRDVLWDEVLRSVYALAVKWRDKPGRKALLWIGYGWSILGRLDAKGGAFPVLVELSTRIREARMIIYDISPWQDPELFDKIPAVDYHQYLSGVRSAAEPGLRSPVPYFALPVLATQSGGLVVDNSQNLEGDLARCVVDASQFYTISFDPPRTAQPDGYHDLAVLIGTEQLLTRTAQGYYNQPVFYDEPREPEKRLNVGEAQQLLESDHSEHDRELAKTLNGLELTERLSTGPLASWKERLHGKECESCADSVGRRECLSCPSDGGGARSARTRRHHAASDHPASGEVPRRGRAHAPGFFRGRNHR